MILILLPIDGETMQRELKGGAKHIGDNQIYSITNCNLIWLLTLVVQWVEVNGLQPYNRENYNIEVKHR